MLGPEQTILRRYVANGDVKLIFWHNLDSSRFGTYLHQVSHCAGNQDPEYFWRMHDFIFQSQTSIVQMNEAQIRDIVLNFGADGDQFDTCMAEEGPAQVDAIEAIAEERGVRSRPVFDINGAQLFGNLEYPVFASAIDTALAEQ